jgi:hypothetical protein
MTASAASAPVRNRRYKRARTPETFQVYWQSAGNREVCHGTCVNLGGLFLVSKTLLPTGTTLKMKIPNPGADIPLNAVVRYSAPGGMGVEFVAVGHKERAKLDMLVKRMLLAAQEEERERKEQPKADAAAPVAPPLPEKVRGPKVRRHARINLPRGLKVAWTCGKQRELTIAGTVSVGGLFVISQEPAPVGSQVRLLFDIPGGEVLATAVVRNHIAGRGMGVEFTAIRAEDRERLEGLLNRLMS